MKLDIYKDSRGEWRWRLRARNGKIVADSGEGYKTTAGVRKAVRRLALVDWGWVVPEALQAHEPPMPHDWIQRIQKRLAKEKANAQKNP